MGRWSLPPSAVVHIGAVLTTRHWEVCKSTRSLWGTTLAWLLLLSAASDNRHCFPQQSSTWEYEKVLINFHECLYYQVNTSTITKHQAVHYFSFQYVSMECWVHQLFLMSARGLLRTLLKHWSDTASAAESIRQVLFLINSWCTYKLSNALMWVQPLCELLQKRSEERRVGKECRL